MNDEEKQAFLRRVNQLNLELIQQDMRDKDTLKQQERLAEQAAMYRDEAALERSLLLAILLRTQPEWQFSQQELEDAQEHASLEYERDENGVHWIRLKPHSSPSS